MKSKVFELCYRLSIVALAIIGTFVLYNPYGMAQQFWFFTIQSNLMVLIMEAILSVCLILELAGKRPKFTDSKPFCFIRLMIAFFISITCIIYCFVLAPTAMHFNGKTFGEMFNFRNIVMHALIPVMSVAGYFVYAKHGLFNKHHAWLCLIYPLLYFAMANLRVVCGGRPFYDGTLYPYFFIDPTIRGWWFVIVCIAIVSIIFYLLATTYIWLDNKIAKNKEK